MIELTEPKINKIVILFRRAVAKGSQNQNKTKKVLKRQGGNATDVQSKLRLLASKTDPKRTLVAKYWFLAHEQSGGMLDPISLHAAVPQIS
jgi:hypothetical protein